jgi:hypothetical protein
MSAPSSSLLQLFAFLPGLLDEVEQHYHVAHDDDHQARALEDVERQAGDVVRLRYRVEKARACNAPS